MEIQTITARQREFFATGKTMDLNVRKRFLRALQVAVSARTEQIAQALRADLGKGECESLMTEISFVTEEIRFQCRKMRRFAKEKRVRASLSQFPASCRTLAVPYGCVLIMSPWNYPFQLTLCPLIDAIAAGNCVVVKSSAYAPATAEVLQEILSEVFPSEYVACVTGGRAENTQLLEQKYDLIFFTGGKNTGTVAAQAAAKTLTPTVLELGGKSPCIVDEDADLPLAAKRIAFGKLLNAGQTCVAPDYILVHERVKDAFLQQLEHALQMQTGGDALHNPDYPCIVNSKHFERVKALISSEKTVYGGRFCEQTRKIEPTVLNDVTADDAAMQEEIFGPILPVLTVSDFEQAKRTVAQHPTPLALYYFGKQNADRAMREIQFGGGCVNDTVMHLATTHMGFGGVGSSGMGAYHGKRGFDAFSHTKSIQRKGRWELNLRYAPYTKRKLRLLRRLFR